MNEREGVWERSDNGEVEEILWKDRGEGLE